jgi:hypothetical protein
MSDSMNKVSSKRYIENHFSLFSILWHLQTIYFRGFLNTFGVRSAAPDQQGCQMVQFQTKNPNLGIHILECLAIKNSRSRYFTGIIYILWPFGIFCGHFGIFFPFGYVVQRKIWQPCWPVRACVAKKKRVDNNFHSLLFRPKRGEIYQTAAKLPNGHEMYQMAVIYSKLP